MIISAAANMILISLICTGIMLLLIIMGKVFDKYIYTGWRVALWMIILVRLCVPYIAEIPIGIIGNSPAGNSYEYQPIEENTLGTAEGYLETELVNTVNIDEYQLNKQAAPTISGNGTLSFAQIFGYIYLAGFAVSFILLFTKSIISKLHSRTLPKCSSSKINTLLKDLKYEMGIKRKVNLLTDKNISIPMVHGILNSLIILPQADLHKDSDTLKIILTHELTHIKQNDIAKLWLMETALCFNWFNPFMRIFKKVIVKDLEIACDQKVLSSRSRVNPYDYSMIIAQYSGIPKSKSILSASIGLISGKSKLLTERLNSINMMKVKKLKLLGIIICMCISILLIACTSTGINKISTLPNSFDLRDEGVVTSPQNQGQYSTGAVFASAGIMEAHAARTLGRLINLSEQQFIDDTDYIKEDSGVSPETVLNYFIENGIVTEQVLPYTGVRGSGFSELEDSGERYYIPSFDSINLNELSHDEQIETVKRSLQQYGVLMTNIGYYKSMDEYDGGIYQSDDAEEAIHGHWVNIVGYADDDNLPSGGYWIVKESWGTNWGEGGYIKIAYNDPCGINDYILYYITDEK